MRLVSASNSDYPGKLHRGSASPALWAMSVRCAWTSRLERRCISLLAVKGQLDGAADLAICTSGDPLSLASAVRQAVWPVDRDQPVSNTASLNDLLDHEVAGRRVQAALFRRIRGSWP